MVRPFYWALAYPEYRAGAEGPPALYVVNWAITGASSRCRLRDHASLPRSSRQLGMFLAIYGAAVFVYPWTLDLFAFPSYQEKWVVFAAALDYCGSPEPREHLPAGCTRSARRYRAGLTDEGAVVVFMPAFVLLVLDARREGRRAGRGSPPL